MKRREKGFKHYAEQRERRMTEPLIREDELEQVREAVKRLSKMPEQGDINSNTDSA